MLIREVILENFMSYEYARVSLKEGVNVVCGPNGSGKSSFLVGICVALGDTYTERSKKLSDLIRWGQERARVSLLLDNSTRENRRRPIPRFDSDVIRLTRNLRNDGKYWFEINQKSAQKYEVMDILKGLGFDPSNMLIIMHQSMPTRFAALSPQDKLKTLETAVGFETYRSDVVEAKKQHQTRIIFLQREMAWSRVAALEEALRSLEQDLERADADLYAAEAEMEKNSKLVLDAHDELKKHQSTWSDLVEQRVEYERKIGICEYTIQNSKESLIQLEGMIKSSGESRRQFEIGTEALRAKLKSGPTTLDDYFNLLAEIEQTQVDAYDYWSSGLEGQRTETYSTIDSTSTQLSQAEAGARDVIEEMSRVRTRIDETNDRYIDGRISMALLKDRRGRLKRRIDGLKADIDRMRRDLNDAEAEALIKGSRVETGRDSEEILGDIRKISGILLGLADVSEDAEAMYESYNRTYKELQERVEQVRKSRRQVMEEIEERTNRWLEVMRNLLDEVNGRYQSLLSMLLATGEVRLVNTMDIEEAGLEIWVGFKGAVPSRLDPYTHSGGERSTSVMAFLLSLQQNVISPFRAVDEFDLHMDPKNKEMVSEFIVNTMEGSSDQYLAITPSQVSFRGNGVHIIMIHKTEGASTVRVVE
jgi:chromosome segregation ATPase